MLFGQEFDLGAALEDECPDDMSDQVASQLADLRAMFVGLAQAIEAADASIKSAQSHVEDVLRRREAVKIQSCTT